MTAHNIKIPNIRSIHHTIIDRTEKLLIEGVKNDQLLIDNLNKSITDEWFNLIRTCPPDISFREYFRICVMEINSFHNAEENLSYFSLLAKHAIRLELDRYSEILDFNEQLKITDYYAGIFDNISAGKSRFSRKFILNLASEFFKGAYNDEQELACINAFLTYESRGKKLSANQITHGINELYSIHREWFVNTRDNQTLRRFIKRHDNPCIGFKHWNKLKAECKEAFYRNTFLQSLLKPSFREAINDKDGRHPNSLLCRALKEVRIWEIAWNALSNSNLNSDNLEGRYARSVFLNPKFSEIEDSLTSRIIKINGQGLANPVSPSQLSKIQPFTSESFVCLVQILSRTNKATQRFLALNENTATSLAQKLSPSFWQNTILKIDERKNPKLTIKLVNFLTKIGCEDLICPPTPIKVRTQWNGKHVYEVERIHFLTFPLWAKHIEKDQLIEIILSTWQTKDFFDCESNRQILIEAIKQVQPCDQDLETLIRRLYSTKTFGKYRSIFPQEFIEPLKLCISRKTETRSGYYKQEILKLVFSRSPSTLWKLLNENADPSTLLVFLRFLEINKHNVQKVFKLRDNDGELLIHTTLKKHLPNRGLVRLLESSGTKRLLELFHLKPRLLFPLLCRKIGSNEATKLVFNDKKLRHLLDEEYLCRYVSNSVESIRASYNEKPAQALAFDTALITSLKDFEFLTYLAWSKSSQWKEGKRFGFFDHLYEEWTIPKKNGDPRKVCSPQARLKRLQHRILERILNNEKIHRNAHGFVPGKSILTNAKPHIKKDIVVNLDLADFFPTTSRQNVFSAFVSIEGISAKTAGFLADICCHKGALPIGAPTSPYLANLILRSFDKAMTSAARKIGAKYTRYADDLTFSGSEECIKLIPFAKKLLKEKGYKLNERKINIFRPGRRQVVTGLTVNQKVNVPRAVRKKLRAALHARELGKTPTWSGYPSNDQQLNGLCSFVRSINRKQGNRLQKSLSQKPGHKHVETL